MNTVVFRIFIQQGVCLLRTTIDPSIRRRGSFAMAIIILSSVMSYNAEDSDAFKTIMFFCGGLEPIDFEHSFGFVVETGGSGARFEGVNLSDSDWESQDEISSNAVSISNLEFRLIKK
ncbi:unnamed protein product [Notodromas monacha]|uniref:Uncharacterized protein n=1 Tax=Notodromas monacha TaxID=399045 RepID=A0A7R9C037_9CRUS|nr:unnamed protein product [Notodromas monacha]CAG0923678.1 unnamed protein product [Notodromas monacha]